MKQGLTFFAKVLIVWISDYQVSFNHLRHWKKKIWKRAPEFYKLEWSIVTPIFRLKITHKKIMRKLLFKNHYLKSLSFHLLEFLNKDKFLFIISCLSELLSFALLTRHLWVEMVVAGASSWIVCTSFSFQIVRRRIYRNNGII